MNRSVLLHLTSKDVIHSFWVPEFGQKQDTVPGIDTTLHITPNRIGTYPVICTELCGLGHAVMRTQAIVMTQAAFDKWLKSQTKATSSPNPSVVRRRGLQEQPVRLVPHADGGRRDGEGRAPTSTSCRSTRRRRASRSRSFIRESITDPNAYIREGLPEERDAAVRKPVRSSSSTRSSSIWSSSSKKG